MRPRLDDPTRTGRRAPRRRRFVVVTAAVALTVAACGGASDTSSDDAVVDSPDATPAADPDTTEAELDAATADSTTPADNAPAADPAGDDTAAPPEAEVEQGVEDDAPAAEVAPASGIVDLIGPDVVETAEIGTNGLPSVVVDDVTSGRKVNFRNLVPQDRPILMWMWAPH